MTLASIRIGRVTAGARRRTLLSAGRGPAPANLALAFTREQTLGVLHPGGSLRGKAFVAAAGGRRMLPGDSMSAAAPPLVRAVAARRACGPRSIPPWKQASGVGPGRARRRKQGCVMAGAEHGDA